MVYVIYLLSSGESNGRWLWALWNKLKDTWIGSLAVATMFASNGVWNMFQNFRIIFKWPHIVRDWVKITNFQQYITNKALKIASKWMLEQNIKNITKIKNYMDWKESFIIKFTGTTYKDLLEYLWRNQLFFEKLYYDEIVLRDNESTIEKNINNNIIENGWNYKINTNSLSSLDIKLAVYNKYKCNTYWSDFKKDLKHVICTIWWDKLSKANKRFKCNYNRLLFVLNLWWSEGNCWSVKVKKWIPLSKRLKAKVSIEWIWKLSYNNRDARNWWTTDTKSLNQMAKDVRKYSWLWNGIKQLWSEINPSNWQTYRNFVWHVSPADYGVEKQVNFINTNLQAVIDDSNDVWYMLDWVEPWKATHGVTLLFPQISQKIDDIRTKLWKTTSSKGTIYKYIEKTCQNQSPQKWNCSY